ncbi:hypothetical protein ABZ638_22835 [Streptomyces sp. NPDC007107]|uniref:hypothetical protein n=1 Tax=Streptomyces sp. NPDC007107 TaxID=3156915 RepID=UPI003401996C
MIDRLLGAKTKEIARKGVAEHVTGGAPARWVQPAPDEGRRRRQPCASRRRSSNGFPGSGAAEGEIINS